MAHFNIRMMITAIFGVGFSVSSQALELVELPIRGADQSHLSAHHSVAQTLKIECHEITMDKNSGPRLTVVLSERRIRKFTLKNKIGRTLLKKKKLITSQLRAGSPYEFFQVPHGKKTLALDESYMNSPIFHGFLLNGKAENTPLNRPEVLAVLTCTQDLPSSIEVKSGESTGAREAKTADLSNEIPDIEAI